MRLFGDRFGWVLARVSTALTVSNWLKQVTLATLAPLVQFNHDAVIDPLGAPRLPQLTKWPFSSQTRSPTPPRMLNTQKEILSSRRNSS